MSLNLSSARSYNQGRNYSVNAIRTIQNRLGLVLTGAFDDTTIKAIYAWQGSPDRLAKLTKDGKFGPSALGCMIAEMRAGTLTSEIAELTPYPHTLPPASAAAASSIVTSFLISNPVQLDLRADGAGWQLRGRFRVNIKFHKDLSDYNRYQYRQSIKGFARSTPGRFRSSPASLTNWEATGSVVNHNSAFSVPGGLDASTWREDGVVGAGGGRKYGYRSAAAYIADGEEDRYLPTQSTGNEYVCLDTYGIKGAHRVYGTKLHLKLDYKGVVIDMLSSGRIIMEKTWSYSAERIIA